MASTTTRWLVRVVLGLCLAALSPTTSVAAPGDLRITLMAAKIDWFASEFSGYAFFCLQAETGSGVTDDCYSFYQNAAGRSFVGGSGVARPELRRTPTRFPKPTVTITRRVTDAQRQAALTVIDSWNQREYEPSALSIMDLAIEVVKATGFQLPPKKSESSEAFLRRLKAFNP